MAFTAYLKVEETEFGDDKFKGWSEHHKGYIELLGIGIDWTKRANGTHGYAEGHRSCHGLNITWPLQHNVIGFMHVATNTENLKIKKVTVLIPTHDGSGNSIITEEWTLTDCHVVHYVLRGSAEDAYQSAVITCRKIEIKNTKVGTAASDEWELEQK